MKAAIYHGPHQDQTFEDVDIDEPRADEVLIRTVASGVCHSDLHYVEGIIPLEAPAILGHEGAGIVEQVGSEVTYVQPGDHVVTRGTFCGTCKQCLTGFPHRCTNRPGRQPGDTPRWSQNGSEVRSFGSQIASFAGQMLIHERGVVKIDRDMPLDAASLMGCGVMTGFGAAIHTAGVKTGATVAVFGAGGIGLAAMQGAYLAGARQIIAVDLLDSKLETSKEFGATHTVNASKEDAVEAIRSLSGGGVDFSFEAIGNQKAAMQSLHCLGVGGLATLIGVVPPGQPLEIEWADLGGDRRLQACLMGSNRFRIDMPRMVEFYKQGRLKLDEMISRRGLLEDLNDMFEALKGGEPTRQVIMFE